MCSYNQINGTYASDNKRLMTDVPRGEWGFEGAVMTHWGAMNDRVAAIRAGLDLEMPGPCQSSEKKILAAVKAGTLSETEVDTCARRITELLLLATQNTPEPYDIDAHDALAARAARESAVLLKLGAALPAQKRAKIAVVGAYGKTPRYQGAGSSKINPHRVTSLCDALDARGIPYTWAAGYEAEQPEPDVELIAQAVAAAKEADLVFACVGLPDSYESEGFDRTHLEMPGSQNALMEALIAAGTPVVAVVSTGSAIVMPWRDRVDSILLLYLTGQNGGTAAADLLFGDANPCGRLAETWPLSLDDCPCGEHFGHGLSYTSFAYSDISVSPAVCTDQDTVQVCCTVTNTGKYAGAEVVQLYVAPSESAVFHPVRELRDYQKVFLQPGEKKVLTFTLDRRAFAWYNPRVSDWFVESREYRIELGASSRDIRLTAPVTIRSSQTGPVPDLRETAPAYYDLRGGLDVSGAQFEALLGGPVAPWRPVRPFSRNSTLGELQTCEMGRMLVELMKQGIQASMGDSSDLEAMISAMLEDMPLRQVAMMDPEHFSDELLEGLLAQLNAQP